MAKAKTLKDRYIKQASRIRNVKNAAGNALSDTEVARRALAQAKRHRDRAKHAKSSNANIRAQADQARLAPRTRKQNIRAGKQIRAGRMRAGQNLATGAAQGALKTGRKAIKKSVRKGSVSAQAGSKAMQQLRAMDPTTRREAVGSAASFSAGQKGTLKGGLKNRQGQALSTAMKAARRRGNTKTVSTSSRRRSS